MRFSSAISSATTPEEGVKEILSIVNREMTAGAIDLAMLFVTGHFTDAIPEIVEQLSSQFPSAVLIGCTGEGAIGRSQEIERSPAMALLAATLPNVSIRPFAIRQKQLESIQTALDWERLIAVSPESKPRFIGFADPFRFDVYGFLERMNEDFPGAPLYGGIASAGSAPRENRLIVAGEIVNEGVVGVALTGEITIEGVVSQGCRPIGKPFVVTKASGNVVRDLGGRPALEQLHNVIVELPPADEKLARESLFVGRAINEFREQFVRGDFLIQNILGADRKKGAIAIAGNVRVGSTIQFHVRDAASADEDLHALLKPHVGTNVMGALLFGCNGRGTRMWPTPGHDVRVLEYELGRIPVAGFFCAGEFGPVGGKNFVHGFTASVALFRKSSGDSIS